MTTILTGPPCSNCIKQDKMKKLPDTITDFGGLVMVWVCTRCGVVGVLTQGERP